MACFYFLRMYNGYCKVSKEKETNLRKGDVNMKEMVNKIKKVLLNSLEMFAAAYYSNSIYRPF